MEPAGTRSTAGASSQRLDDRLLWAQFRKPSTSAGAFYRAWLAILCHRIDGAVRGAVLIRGANEGAFSAAATWPDGQGAEQHLVAAAQRVLSEPRAMAIEVEVPAAGVGIGPQPAAKAVVLGHPIENGKRLLGAVLLEITPRPRDDVEKALRELVWGSAWMELRTGRAGGGSRGSGTSTLLDLIAVPHEHERFGAAANAFASELATRFACQQVSLGFVEAGRVRLRAVSQSARFSARTNLNRAREAAMEEALDQQVAVVWPAPGDGAPQVTREHERLAQLAEAASVCSLLFSHGPTFRGVVTLERPAGQPLTGPESELLQAAVDLTGPLLDAQRRDDRWIGPKLLEAIFASCQRLVGPGHVALKVSATAAVALLAFLALAKGEYRVSADSVLEARELRAAVAPFDGYVAEAPARAGDRVRAGALLATLDDRELRLEETRAASQVEQLASQYRQAVAQSTAADVRILAARLGQVRAQLGVARDRLAKTRIEAPVDGVVVTGDLSQNLGAPVQRGDLLFEVAPLDEYRLVLQVDERDIDELAVGQRGRVAFAAFPEEGHPFTVEKITPISTPGDGKNTFRVEVTLAEIPARLQPGMEGVAKVEIDRRRLLWIWTHEATDWLRLALWRWLP